MRNDLINRNIEDLDHLDNHQQFQELNLVHQVEIHQYSKYLYEIPSEFYHPKFYSYKNHSVILFFTEGALAAR